GHPGEHGHLNRGHDLAGFGAEHREAENTVALRVDEHLHKSPRFRNGHCAKDIGHGQPGKTIRDAELFGLRFAKSNSSELRVGEHAKWDLPSRSHAITAGNIITN